MDNLSASLKYIIELTEAYDNGFITKDEYKELREYNILMAGLIISKAKKFHELLMQSAMLSMTLQQMQVILSKPKSKFEGCSIFESGAVIEEYADVITSDNKTICFTPSIERMVKLPTNIKL